MTEDELVGAIRAAAGCDRIALPAHAKKRLRDRSLAEWHVVAITSGGEVDHVETVAVPHPKVNFRGPLPDGTDSVVVCAYVEVDDVARVVTVYLVDW